MNRNMIYLVALIGLHLVLLQWYTNEVHKLDTDNSGCVSNAEIAGQSSGDTIPGLTPEATKTIKAVCVKNGDQKLDEGELDNFERDASAADKPAAATTKSVDAAILECQEGVVNPWRKDICADVCHRADTNKDGKLDAEEQVVVKGEIKSWKVKALSYLKGLKDKDYRSMFGQASTAMRKNKIASLILLVIFLVPMHRAGALPNVEGFVDSVQSSFSKVDARLCPPCTDAATHNA